MGIQINGQTDTVTAIDGSINVGGDVTIPGVLTYEDVTNVDSVGVITARDGIRVTGGSVGIGTDNPTAPLQINHISPKIILEDNDNGADVSIANIGGAAVYSSQSDILFQTTDTSERLRITSAGLVGIGTDNPGAILDVRETKTAGSTQVRVYNTDNSNATTQTAEVSLSPDSRGLAGAGIKVFKENADFSTNAGRDISLALNAVQNNSQTEAVRITSSGNIGIGTDNPSVKLEVATSVDGEATLATFKNTSAGGTNETVDIKLGLENNVASNVILRAGKEANHSSGAAADNFFAIHTTLDNTSSEKLRITSDGNIGVNTTSPGVQSWRSGKILDIHGGAGNVTGELHIGANRGDGAQSVGSINFYDNTQDSTHRHVALIESDKGGTTTNKRGGQLVFYTKPDNVASPAERLRITSAGQLNLAGNMQFTAADPELEFNNGGPRFRVPAANTLTIHTGGGLSATSNERLRVNSDGRVSIATTNVQDSKAMLVVEGLATSSSVYMGRVHDSTNSNNRTVLLFRMNQTQGFQFSGDIMVNSWTGNAKVNCHITVRYNDQAVEVDVINATHSAQISKSQLRVVTADYGSDRYLGIQKNGGGTGVFYINAYIGSNIDNSGGGGIREVNNSSLGSVTSHGNLN